MSPPSPSSRKILPRNATPSIAAQDLSADAFNPESCRTKVDLRIQTFFINRTISQFIGYLSRGQTRLQGLKSTEGFAAAHASLEPATTDTFTQQIFERIVTTSLSPTKTIPFLQTRCNLTQPQIEELKENHSNKHYVFQFLSSHLPPGGFSSSIAGSRYEWNCNATFDNPLESNQYDSTLERKIRSYREALQAKCHEGSIDPGQATTELVKWLINYYDTSIEALSNRLPDLKTFQSLHEELLILEQEIDASPSISDELLMKYLTHVGQFIGCTDRLKEKKNGCPSCLETLHAARNDYKFLKKLIGTYGHKKDLEEIRSLLATHSRRTHSLAPISLTPLIKKHEMYQNEATIQRETTAHYSDPCAMTKLQDIFFPEAKEGKLQDAVFAICKPKTPEKRTSQKRSTYHEPHDLSEENKEEKNGKFHRTLSLSSPHPEDRERKALSPIKTIQKTGRSITPIPFPLFDEVLPPTQETFDLSVGNDLSSFYTHPLNLNLESEPDSSPDELEPLSFLD